MQSKDNQILQELLEAYENRDRDSQHSITEKTIPAGTTFIDQGKVPENVYLVLQGTIRVHIDTPKGTEYLVSVEGPGELIGEVEALTGEQATCSVTTIQQSKVAVIPNATYKQWLKQDHNFSLTVNKSICQRLQTFTRRAVIHLTYPMEYSVLKLLKMMSNQHPSTPLNISKEEIANYLGTSTRSINRILKDLQAKNVLSAAKGIQIVSMENLDHAMRTHDE